VRRPRGCLSVSHAEAVVRRSESLGSVVGNTEKLFECAKEQKVGREPLLDGVSYRLLLLHGLFSFKGLVDDVLSCR